MQWNGLWWGATEWRIHFVEGAFFAGEAYTPLEVVNAVSRHSRETDYLLTKLGSFFGFMS